jgi:hypothetical protein
VPLLKVPPDDLALKYSSAILPGDNTLKEWKLKQAKENAFMVCAMMNALDAAAKFYKDQHSDEELPISNIRMCSRRICICRKSCSIGMKNN